MALEELHQDRVEILKILSDVFTAALSNGSQHEPQLVANLIYHFPKIINARLPAIAERYGVQIKTGGVFVHQTPKVKVSNFPESKPKSVEIGDALFVITHKRLNGTISRSSLLLQAKKVDDWPVEIKAGEKNQHHLYAYWPETTYIWSPKALTGKKRQVTGQHMYSGAKYLFLQKDGYKGCVDEDGYFLCNGSGFPFTAQPTYPVLSSYSYFIYELYNLLFGNAGREFVYQPNGNNTNWDQVMTDLMTVTAERITSLMAHGKPKGPRGGKPKGPRGQGNWFISGEPISFMAGEVSDKAWTSSIHKGDGPPEVPPRPEGDKHGDGISIIEIFTEETKQRIKG